MIFLFLDRHSKYCVPLLFFSELIYNPCTTRINNLNELSLMLNHRDSLTAIMIYNRRNEINHPFGCLPKEIINIIINVGYDPNPDSEIGQALHCAAYARQQDVETLLAMLTENPFLLLQAGDVKTPGGDLIKRVKIYEYCLGAADYELAKMVQTHFAGIPNGEQERSSQYELYKSHIENMLTQKPYDLTNLIDFIKTASSKDVQALLNNDLNKINNQGFSDEISKFRNHYMPRVIIEPCIYYNYASYYHVLKILKDEWSNLYKASGNNYDKINLVWCLKGLKERRFPGVDRCMAAQGMYNLFEKKEEFKRTYEFSLPDLKFPSEFPSVKNDISLNELGSVFSIDVIYGKCDAKRNGVRGRRGDILKTVYEIKAANLLNLSSSAQPVNRKGL